MTTVSAPRRPKNIAHMMTTRPVGESRAVVSPSERPVVVTAEITSKKSASPLRPRPASVNDSTPLTSQMNASITLTMTMDSRTTSFGTVRREMTVSSSPRHIARSV